MQMQPIEPIGTMPEGWMRGDGGPVIDFLDSWPGPVWVAWSAVAIIVGLWVVVGVGMLIDRYRQRGKDE
jgi:hypothetical protein